MNKKIQLNNGSTRKAGLNEKLTGFQQRSHGGLQFPPHWPEKYAKQHVFGAFEPEFCSKNENSHPQRDWGAKVVKNLPLFGPQKLSFFC